MKDNPFAPGPQQGTPPKLPAALEGCHASREQLTLDRIIGRGQFGEVRWG